MIGTDQLLAFGIAAAILIVIPGPSVIFVIGRALTYGRTVALASVLGNTLGLVVIALLVAVGLGVVVAESVLVFTILKYAGAAYLVYLGIRAIQHRRGFQDAELTEGPVLTRGAAVRQGFVVGVSNPKAFMIFGALLPQFVDRARRARPAADARARAARRDHRRDHRQPLGGGRPRASRGWFTGSPKRGETLGAVGGVSMIACPRRAAGWPPVTSRCRR